MTTFGETAFRSQQSGHALSDNPLAADLDAILGQTTKLWQELRGERIFITGGTGFIGCWLLESFAWANERLSLGAVATVLTRDAAGFARKAPHLCGLPSIVLHEGDVRTFAVPQGKFGSVIHAATEASVTMNKEQPLKMFETIIGGTNRALEMAADCDAKRFLFVSSGAVYGRQPPELSHTTEEYVGAPDPVAPGSAYGEGKRAAELMCAQFSREKGFEATMARCFAFIGPYLPVDSHFAAGNFIRDRLRGDAIKVDGDGSSLRSYLYASDLAVWLWTLLVKGEPGRAYNVGSEHAVTIEQLAGTVARCGNGPASPVRVALPRSAGVAPERYVPSTLRIRSELGLSQTVDLQGGIERTLRWHARRAQ